MVSACCIFCSAQHSLANIENYSVFSSALKSVLTSLIGVEVRLFRSCIIHDILFNYYLFQLVEKVPVKYVCLDCIIQIHNSSFFVYKTKCSVQKMTVSIIFNLY